MRIEELQKFFDNYRIPTNTPGFYDHPSFLELEKTEPYALDFYYMFVLSRDYDQQYSDRARKIVPELCRFLFDYIIRERKLGNCEEISHSLSCMLNKLGIWSAVETGGHSVEFPQSTGLLPTGIYPIGPKTEGDTRHCWVIAPPFRIIDLAIETQRYTCGEEKYLKGLLLKDSKDCRTILPRIRDLLDPEEFRRLTGEFPTLEVIESLAYPDLTLKLKMHPSITFDQWNCNFKYFGLGTMALDRPFEQFDMKCAGKSIHEIFREFVTKNVTLL